MYPSPAMPRPKQFSKYGQVHPWAFALRLPGLENGTVFLELVLVEPAVREALLVENDDWGRGVALFCCELHYFFVDWLAFPLPVFEVFP